MSATSIAESGDNTCKEKMHWQPVVLTSCLLLVVLWTYRHPITQLIHRWNNEADYSHCFLVPIFSVWLLWIRRNRLESKQSTLSLLSLLTGVLLLSGGMALRLAGIRWQYRLFEPFSLIPVLGGLVLIVGGWRAFRWSWPAVFFLFFMIPMPGFIANLLSNPLQFIATACSTFVLQCLGVPAVAQGNVIWLSEAQIGVVEACSGLRMLNVFLTLTVGCSFLVNRPIWQKGALILSTPIIGIVANIFRITSTGLAHEHVGSEFADKLFHDFAGWVMMPLAVLLLVFELYIFNRVFVEATEEIAIPLQRRVVR